jgi:predicted lipid-binding transport protein (Tim44 family)
MGDFQYFDIVLFAMIAAFLVLRLRSVLGRRTGNERRRELFTRRSGPVIDGTAQQAPAAADADQNAGVARLPARPTVSAADGLARIRRADPGFDQENFLAGVRSAFEMIVNAFARGDKEALRPLLSDDVYQPFSKAIDDRVAAKETLESRDLRLNEAEIVEADLVGRIARATVKLVSHQINVTRSVDGGIVEGDPEHPVEKTDHWTFARDTRSADPNWQLVATGSG